MNQILVAVLAAALFVVFQTVFVINEWEQGLVTQFGRPIRTIEEAGLYYKIPMLHTLTRFDRRVLTTEAHPGEYLTLDKKRTLLDYVPRWRISDPLDFYRTVRDETGAMARLNDIIFAQLRQEIAKHNFIDFIRERREAITGTVTAATREGAKPFGIEVIDVRIKRADLPTEVQNSVFERMRAERQRIAKRYRAEGDEQARQIRAQADKEREILLAKAYNESRRLTGEGDARSTAIYADAFEQDAEFYAFLRRLEAYEKILREGTTLVLRPDSDLLQYLRGAKPKGAER
jgi:membrane protease subunit HflC